MSTRSMIGAVLKDGSVAAVYCHSDGYVEEPGVGWTLQKSWRSSEKIAKLLELGNLSCLGDSIGRKHSFEKKSDASRKTLTTAYGRDRGDKENEASRYRSRADFAKNPLFDDAEYLYLFDKDGEWKVMERGWDGSGSKTWKKLSDALRKP